MLKSWRMARRLSRAGRDERRRQRRLSQRRRRVLRLIRDHRRHYSDANTYSHGARSIGSSGGLLAIGMMDEPIRPAINTESRFLDIPWTLLNLGILYCSSLSVEMVCLDLIQMPWNILLQPRSIACGRETGEDVGVGRSIQTSYNGCLPSSAHQSLTGVFSHVLGMIGRTRLHSSEVK